VHHGMHSCNAVWTAVQEGLAHQCFSACSALQNSYRSAVACERMLAAHSPADHPTQTWDALLLSQAVGAVMHC
jgi:hypothetical protein